MAPASRPAAYGWQPSRKATRIYPDLPTAPRRGCVGELAITGKSSHHVWLIHAV
ncbi:hypothetical protein K438DRAFT_1849352 [Mycena galopus ATCC 62051]|nr:hypothetical protein K438DRAFT_1849352 [Mycena galopus ATCC 62051]